MGRTNIANETAAVEVRGALNTNFIELFSNKPENFCGYFKDASALALYENSEGFTVIDEFYCYIPATASIYEFDKDSEAEHTGTNVIRPAAIEESEAGRWLLISSGGLPSSIPADSIEETSEKQFVSAAKKAKYDAYEGQIADMSKYSFSERVSFYPSVIMDKHIKNNTDYLWNTDSFKITDIDFDTKIITVDKKIELPLFYENTDYNKWQIHKKRISANDNNSLLQLKEVVSANSFEFEILSYQGESYLIDNFTVGSDISFRNPYTFYIPTNTELPIYGNSKYISDNDISIYYPMLIVKNEIKYKALIVTIKSNGNWYKTNVVESEDFITWTEIDKTNEIDLSFIHNLYTWWFNPQPSVINGNFFLGNSNVKDENGNYILPVSLFVTSTYQRIGWIKFDNNLNPVSTSSTYFVCEDIPDTSLFTWAQTSMMEYKGKVYLASEIANIPNTTKGRRVGLFECDFDNMSLTMVDIITPSEKGNYKWNDISIQQPSLFVYKNQMFLTCRGYGADQGTYNMPNGSQPNGLYYFDEVSKKLNEHYSNPMILNPKLCDWGGNYYDHGGYNVYLEDGEILFALLSFSHGNNQYNVLPCTINVQGEKAVNQWEIFNK